MNDREWLAQRFEDNRDHLRSVAYGMLGSLSDAEDAVQEAWLRVDRSEAGDVENLQAWLTTIVARISLDMLRRRRTRREQVAGTWLPEPVVTVDEGPEGDVLLADAVGIAMLVVLEQLTPAERLAFVLHDVFAVPFDEVGQVLGKTTEAARQLATRARRRVRGAPVPDSDLAAQRRVVEAFLAAARAGDMNALLEVLDPDVVFRSDLGEGRRPADPVPVVGAQRVAERVLRSAPTYIHDTRPAIVNGAAGAVFARGGQLGVVGITVAGGRIAAIDLIADPEKLGRVQVSSSG